MAQRSTDQHDPSSKALMEKLDELLVDCTPTEIEDPGIHGTDYMVGLDELRKVSCNKKKKVLSYY